MSACNTLICICARLHRMQPAPIPAVLPVSLIFFSSLPSRFMFFNNRQDPCWSAIWWWRTGCLPWRTWKACPTIRSSCRRSDRTTCRSGSGRRTEVSTISYCPTANRKFFCLLNSFALCCSPQFISSSFVFWGSHFGHGKNRISGNTTKLTVKRVVSNWPAMPEIQINQYFIDFLSQKSQISVCRDF